VKLARDQAVLDSTAERMDEKFDWIRDAAGDRFGELVFHAWLKVAHVTDDAEKVVAPLIETFGGRVEDVLASPVVLVGTVDEILGRLRERRDRWGYTYYTIQQSVTERTADEPRLVCDRGDRLQRIAHVSGTPSRW